MATKNHEFAIYVRGLRKSYGNFEAVKGIDFEVRPGEVFGLLGPNGAGKTSTVEILEGLRPRSGGEVTVLDFDPERQKQKLKDRIGVCLQATNLPDKITVREALELFGAFYSRTVDRRAAAQTPAALGKEGCRLRHAFGWAKAAARDRSRPDQRSANALSR